MNIRLAFVTIIAGLSLLVGCDNPHREVVITTQGQQPAVAVQQTNPTLMDSSDLDLSTISELIRSGRVQDALTLQSTINDPQNALNNVDIDHDGQVDPITVAEVQTSTGKQFNLVANPAAQQATPVANINLSMVGTQVVVQAGYPSYVRGYDTNYYTYQTAQNLAFMAWAMGARPVFVPQPYTYYGYRSHPVSAPDVVTRQRTTYTTQQHVSPIPRSAPPSSFTQQAQAAKVPSGFQASSAARPTPTTSNLSDRGSAQDFKTRDGSKPVQQATGFGVRPSTPVSSPAPVTAPTTQRSPSFSPPPSQPVRSSPPPSSPRPSFRSSSPSGPRTSPRR